ncbi:U2 small nuclear ribonucleoprotein auxiliary factor 35 kDa subunit-related protein 2 isoform X2 [Engraulis encrasicolus]|uniref:U2 small nuclear ribonucleoprotein auxiliary factor 35 kDa subunit-related protein 2 isoform X2 n=1 Tax=Engraulis encrasicolus TaxID=184585 RepID=UPI002FD3AE1C
MAALTPPKTTPSLRAVICLSSQKQRRAAQRRERRKKKRQALAKIRDSEQTDCQEDGDVLGDGEEEVEDEAEDQRQRLHELWLERERAAQEEYRIKKEREDAAKRKKEEEERRIKEEWEEEQRKERESSDLKQQERRDREDAAQKMLDQAENELEKVGSWRNPEAPAHGDFGTEKDRANCPFFLKTGACRFGDRCSRKHEHPASSTTLLVKGMFVHYGMEQCRRDDFDTDANLEFSEEEVYQQFRDFYEDALPEFKNVGTVVQFKVSCNFEPHLRGNVYVQYATEEECGKAFVTFNGRWYAGRQLQCEFCPVTRWKTAICGLFDRQRCPKGKHCNFLHVFRNPTREFIKADQDLHLSPDRDGSFTGRFSERSWSQRSHHHSPDRRPSWRRSIRRSRSRDRDRRSKSRERRSRSRSRESRVRGRRSRSGSRESRTRGRRSRSGSRESKRSFRDAYRRGSVQSQRSRRSSRSRSRERQRSRSRERNGGRRSREGSPLRTPRSESKNEEEPAKKSRKKDKNAKEDTADTPRRHKHSKKSKKKSKKKHKRKSSKSPDSSSAESGKDTEDEKDKNDDQSMSVQEDKNDDQVQPTSVQDDVGDDYLHRSPHEDSYMCPASPIDAENANESSILKENNASMEALGETDVQTVPVVPDIQEKLLEEEVSEGHEN